jgi:hypothetical protein
MIMSAGIDNLTQACLHFQCSAAHLWRGTVALWRSGFRELCLWITVGVFVVLSLTGCAAFGKHRAKVRATELIAGAQADAPKDNATPASVDSSGEELRLPIPAGSVIKETRTDAIPAVPATAEAPAVLATPATIVREIHLPAETVLTQKAQRVDTRTGTIDTSVRLKQVEAEESRWLLWAAIGCGIGGIVVRSALPAWPGLSNGLLLGAACAFVAWKFSALPAWLFLLPIALMAAKALGYKRAEWDANGDGVPDLLQRKTKTPPASDPQP